MEKCVQLTNRYVGRPVSQFTDRYTTTVTDRALVRMRNLVGYCYTCRPILWKSQPVIPRLCTLQQMQILSDSTQSDHEHYCLRYIAVVDKSHVTNYFPTSSRSAVSVVTMSQVLTYTTIYIAFLHARKQNNSFKLIYYDRLYLYRLAHNSSPHSFDHAANGSKLT
jgi:hypothetical protein